LLAGAELLVAAAEQNRSQEHHHNSKQTTEHQSIGWLAPTEDRLREEKEGEGEREREGEVLRCDIQPSPGQPGYLRMTGGLG